MVLFLFYIRLMDKCYIKTNKTDVNNSVLLLYCQAQYASSKCHQWHNPSHNLLEGNQSNNASEVVSVRMKIQKATNVLHNALEGVQSHVDSARKLSLEMSQSHNVPGVSKSIYCSKREIAH